MGAALPIGLGISAAGSLFNAFGQNKQNAAAGRARDQLYGQATGMMQQGPSVYQNMLGQLLGGRQAPGPYDPNTGAITGISGANPGNDALMQFLRSDPSRQLPFDASKSFDLLRTQDQRTQQDALGALNANFSSGLGQRFGSAAMRQGSDLLANLGAQRDTRNAGILQSSYENAANRSMQGLGLQAQAASALAGSSNQQNNLLAQIAMANQQNQQWGQAFNQNNQNQFFNQQLAGLQAGSGMQNAQNSYNAQLLGIAAGLPLSQGNGYTAFGGALGELGQAAAFYPMLQGMNRPPSGTLSPINAPQISPYSAGLVDPNLAQYAPSLFGQRNPYVFY